MATNGIGRFEGRLFAEDGRLYYVVEADEAAGTARVSCRIAGEHRVIEMPVAEVAQRISAGSDLVLDNINSNETSKRVLRKDDGWYFSAREGLMGPYDSDEDAERELGRYILAAQSPKTAAS